MAQLVARLLPLAVVVAASPVPVIPVVLMLLTPRPGAAGVAFLAGRSAGIAGITAVGLLLAAGSSQDGGRSASVASYVAVFTAAAASTVEVLVLAHAFGHARLHRGLHVLRGALVAHSTGSR